MSDSRSPIPTSPHNPKQACNQTTRRKPHATEESMFKGWTLDRFLDRLPMFAVTVGRKFPDDVSDEVLQAWSDGIQDVADNVKDMIAEWRRVNGR